MGGIIDLIAQPLGWIMSMIYGLVNNYLLTILIFTFFVRLILFPISLKQQKNTMDRARLIPRLEILQKKYANDRQKLAQKQQELYERHGVSMTGGCLPMILSMLVLFGVIGVIYAPVTKLDILPDRVNTMAEQAVVCAVNEKKLPASVAEKMTSTYAELTMMQNAVVSKDYIIEKIDTPTFQDLNLVFDLNDTENVITAQHKADYDAANAEAKGDKAQRDKLLTAKGYNATDKINQYDYYLNIYKTDATDGRGDAEFEKDLNGDGKVSDGEYYYNKIVDMSDEFYVFGIEDMSMLEQPWKEGGFKDINLLWLIPLISGASAFFVSFVSTRYNKASMPSQQGQQGCNQGCMTNGMMIYMPAMSLFIAFTVPGAVGIYWILSNLFSLLQTVILHKIYDPAKARAEAERELQERRRKKAEDKKRLAMARQREEAEARKAEQALERQREESREMNKKKKKKGSSGNTTHAKEQSETTENGATDAVDTQPVNDTDDQPSAE